MERLMEHLGGLTRADILFVYSDFETGLLAMFDNGEGC